MSQTRRDLLFVFNQCEPTVSTEDFNGQDHVSTLSSQIPMLIDFKPIDWYDNDHIPARQAIPGITTISRYRASKKEEPEWITLYELASLDVLNTKPYLSLRNTASEKEKKLVHRLPIHQQRTYTFMKQASKPNLPPGALPGKYILAVLWSITKEDDDDFHRWYDEEHTADVSRMRGWLRGRWLRCSDAADLGGGKGPTFEGWNYLVIHDYETGGALKTPEVITSRNTPWLKKVINGAKGLWIEQFELHKSF